MNGDTGLTIATWVLAIATIALAAEGGTALFKWMRSLRPPGRHAREIAALRRQVTLLWHAVWLDVTPGVQGDASDAARQIQDMLKLDGWKPDEELMRQAGRNLLSRRGA